MRILNLVAGQKWTGIAAVVFDQTGALIRAGVEAQFGFVGESPLAERLHPLGWARPILRPQRSLLDIGRDVRRLSDLLTREAFDVVHAHATHDHHIAERARRGTRCRLARTIHNLRHVRRDPITRRLFAKTDAFAFGNSEIAAAFGAPGPVHSPVVDADVFHPDASSRPRASRGSLGLPLEAFLVGTVGKMAEGRGHREAIAAAAALPAVSLVHVGHGELQHELRRVAERFGAAGRNFWMGYQEERLPELYRSWDAFLFPASGSEQGQRALLEAMASGTPVVALDVPGVNDLLTNGREGFIAGSPADLGPALARLAADPSLARKMGAAGRERALSFTGERYARRALEFYEGVLGDRRAPGNSGNG